MKITDVILDFDGTCTDIPLIYEAYLSRYLTELNNKVFTQTNVTPDEWKDAQQIVRDASPKAPWTLMTTPAAPAAADPYILAFEASKYLMFKKQASIPIPPTEINSTAAGANPAPWRTEARDVFNKILDQGINIHFVSNSSSAIIKGRVLDLLNLSTLPSNVSVQSDAAKFNINELHWYPIQNGMPDNIRQQFESLPVAIQSTNIDRPVYLRRGSYFEAIYSVFGNDFDRLKSTVFCGDIWEMDLAMPHALGGNIHLIERAAPFNTYDFEREAINASSGKISQDLRGLLDWI